MAGRLLIVDDDEGIVSVIRLVARQLGMDVRALDDPQQVGKVFMEYRPDIVVIDMIMPKKDGIDILNEILSTGVPTKVVVTSGFGNSYLRLAQGVARFHGTEPLAVLKKPFRRAELVALLSTIEAE